MSPQLSFSEEVLAVTTTRQTSHDVIPVDGEEDKRAPPEEAPFVAVPPEDSDIEEDKVPLAARLRKRTVFSDEDLGGSDRGARGEEASSRRACSEEVPADSSRQERSPRTHAAEASAPAKGSAALHSVVKRK